VADITYIRLNAEFVYFAVILDQFSCKVAGLGTGSNARNAADSQSSGAGDREAVY